MDPTVFEERFHTCDEPRSGDVRTPFDRDMGRVVHSSGFRRLQGKTQVMGPGEGDFHRTRLTHSIETGQIGQGLLRVLKHAHSGDESITSWLPSTSLLIAACFAHDLGHPAFGHGGEKALQQCMIGHGGFEGNAQTIRIVSKLEKYRLHQGLNPTRRTLLAVLKYPVCYDDYLEDCYRDTPPKCFFGTEREIIGWVLKPFNDDERAAFGARDSESDRPIHMSLDASIMECADDIAYGVHDLEDIVARKLVVKEEIIEVARKFLDKFSGKKIGPEEDSISLSDFEDLFKASHDRKQVIGRLVNLFVTNVSVRENTTFTHPLLRYRLHLPEDLQKFQSFLKKEVTYKLVVERAAVQVLERKGREIVKKIFEELISDPEKLIPRSAWDSLDGADSKERRVCDYIAGMTDIFAERTYHRLFTPGFGSSGDEL